MCREVELAAEWVATECSVRVCFFNDTATTEIYTLSLHDALPIYPQFRHRGLFVEIEHPVTGKTTFPSFSFKTQDMIPVLNRAPLLGEHNKEVLI